MSKKYKILKWYGKGIVSSRGGTLVVYLFW